MKTAGDDVWRYDSPLWADDSVLDAESDPLAPGNAKYPAYNSQCFDAIQALFFCFCEPFCAPGGEDPAEGIAS